MLPLGVAPAMSFGSKAVDFGHFMLDAQQRDALLASTPGVEKWIRPCLGGEGFLNGGMGWCLWLKGISPTELRAMPAITERVELVRQERLRSKKLPTRESAKYSSLFGEDRQPDTAFLVIPKVSSERRQYLPLGFLTAEYITTPSVLVVPDATLFDFGILQSAMHMSWMRYTCGRMKSDYQYSNTIVYNNFPWPELTDIPSTVRTERSCPQDGEVEVSPAHPSTPSAGAAYAQGERTREDQRIRLVEGHKHRVAIEHAAQAVLDARAAFPESTLADLYDPLSMPPVLVKAHQALDRAVDAAYLAAEKIAGRKPPRLGSDAERVAFLFERYQQLTSLLPGKPAKSARRRRRTTGDA